MTSFFDIANEELKTSQPVRKSYFELGKSLYVHGMYEKAKTQFFEALNVQDESVEDWRLYTALFDVCSQTGKAEEARDHFLRIMATAPAAISEDLVRKAKEINLAIEPVHADSNANDKLLLEGEKQFLRYQDKSTENIAEWPDAAAVSRQKDQTTAKILETIEGYFFANDLEKAEHALQLLPSIGNKLLEQQKQIFTGAVVHSATKKCGSDRYR